MNVSTSFHLNLTEGSTIVTRDGQRVGKLKEIHDRYIKVDAPWRPDYWLALDEVLSADGEQVVLTIAKSELEPYKYARPASTGRKFAA